MSINKTSILVILISLFSFSKSTNAQFKIVSTEDLELIYYNFGHEYLINHSIRNFTNALEFHKEKFAYKVNEPIHVIMSDFGDFAQGGATAVPNNVVLMGIAPFSYAYETNQANERIGVLMKHELVHIIAQEKPSNRDLTFRKIFGGKVAPDKDNPISMGYSYLTNPRIYAPRWYHEGIADYMTTWMNGGIGRVMGGYDEMMFRTMVRDSMHIYDAVGLESEGTTNDFEIGSNSYMYGTRFMAYLSNKYGPNSLLDWVSRDDESKSFYAKQFKNTYGISLDDEWSNWIEWEKEWQSSNLNRIRSNTVTQGERLSTNPLGAVSNAVYDKARNKLIFAADLPGEVAHITTYDLDKGTFDKVTDVIGSAVYFVSSLTYDKKSGSIFYTNNNNGWRDLFTVNIDEKKPRQLIKDLRAGYLVFNEHDESLWAVRHFNGIASLIRIPKPYDDWERVYTMPYGEDLFDIDISPNGKYLSAAIGDVSGFQKLVLLEIDELMNAEFNPKEIYDFDVSSPASFTFSDDGKFLFGSSYYSGVSNITRYSMENETMEWLSNAETGLFKPVPLNDEKLIAFEYSGNGFYPIYLENKPVKKVSAIHFLGQEIVENHPIVMDWILPPPSQNIIDVNSIKIGVSDYKPIRKLKLNSIYPIIHGYKDYFSPGVKININDPMKLHNIGIELSFTNNSLLENDENVHASASYEFSDWAITGTYNGADFYDLFGPTKKSRKGYSLGLSRNFNLIEEVDKNLSANISGIYFGGMERLPNFQNIITSFDQFFALSGSINYQSMRASLGAVDYEKGFQWSMSSYNNYVAETLFPRISQSFDFGIPLPVKHSSFWVRSSAGISFSPRKEPLGNFYFGGFGNNWIDNQYSKRYRNATSFPGVELNKVGGTNYMKIMGELSLPPIRFKKLGFNNYHVNWAQMNLFSSTLMTNLDDSKFNERFFNIGAQIDFRLSMIQILSSTLSIGYATAIDDLSGESYNELMISLRLMR